MIELTDRDQIFLSQATGHLNASLALNPGDVSEHALLPGQKSSNNIKCNFHWDVTTLFLLWVFSRFFTMLLCVGSKMQTYFYCFQEIENPASKIKFFPVIGVACKLEFSNSYNTNFLTTLAPRNVNEHELYVNILNKIFGWIISGIHH